MHGSLRASSIRRPTLKEEVPLPSSSSSSTPAGPTYDPFLALEAAAAITEESSRRLFSLLDCGDRGVVSWAELTAFCLDGAMLAKNHGEKADALSEWNLEPNPLRAEAAGGVSLQRPASLRPMHGVETVLVLDRRHGLLTVDPSQETAKSVEGVAGLSAPVLAFEYVKDEDCFVVSTMAGELAVYDPRESGTLEKISAGIGPVTVIRYHPHLKRLLVGGREGRVAVYQVERSKWRRILPLKFVSRLCCHNELFKGIPHDDGVMMATLMESGAQVGAAPDRDLSAAASRIINESSVSMKQRRPSMMANESTAAFLSTDKSATVGGSGGGGEGANKKPQAPVVANDHTSSSATNGVVDICFHRRSGVIVIGYDDCLVQVIVPSGRTDIRSFYATGGTLCSVAICEDQGAIIIGTSDKKPLEVWSLSTGEGQVKPYYLDSRNARHESPVIGIVTMPLNAQCFTLDFLGLLKVWDLRTFSPLQSFHLEVRDPRHGWSSLVLSGGGAIYCCDRQTVTCFRRKEDASASIHTLTTSAHLKSTAIGKNSNKPDVPSTQQTTPAGANEGNTNADGTSTTKARNRRAILDRQAAIESADVVTAVIFATISISTNQLLLCTTRLLKIMNLSGALIAEIDLSVAAGAAVVSGYALSESTYQAARAEIAAGHASRFRSRIHTAQPPPVHNYSNNRQEITTATVDENGKRLFCGLASGAVVVVNTSTGGIVAAYPTAHASPVATITFASHLNCAVSCGNDGSGSFLYSVGIETAADTAITLSPTAVSNFSDADIRASAPMSAGGGSSTNNAARLLSPAALLTQTPIPAFRCMDGCSIRYLGPPIYILLACDSDGHMSGYDCRTFDLTGAASVTPLFSMTIPLGLMLKGLLPPKGYSNAFAIATLKKLFKQQPTTNTNTQHLVAQPTLSSLVTATRNGLEGKHNRQVVLPDAHHVDDYLKAVFFCSDTTPANIATTAFNNNNSNGGDGDVDMSATLGPSSSLAPFAAINVKDDGGEDDAAAVKGDDLDGFLLSTIDRTYQQGGNNNNNNNLHSSVNNNTTSTNQQQPQLCLTREPDASIRVNGDADMEDGLDKQQYFGRHVVGHAAFKQYNAMFVVDSRRITLLSMNRPHRQGIIHGQWMFELFESNDEANKFENNMKLPLSQRLKYLDSITTVEVSDNDENDDARSKADVKAVTKRRKKTGTSKKKRHTPGTNRPRIHQQRDSSPSASSSKVAAPSVFARGFSKRPKVPQPMLPALRNRLLSLASASVVGAPNEEGGDEEEDGSPLSGEGVSEAESPEPHRAPLEEEYTSATLFGEPSSAVAFQSSPSPRRATLSSRPSFFKDSSLTKSTNQPAPTKRKKKKATPDANLTIEQRLLGRSDVDNIQSNDPAITFIQFDEDREEIYLVADLNNIIVIDVASTLRHLKMVLDNSKQHTTSLVSPGQDVLPPPRWVARVRMTNPIVSLESVGVDHDPTVVDMTAAMRPGTGVSKTDGGGVVDHQIGATAAQIFGITIDEDKQHPTTSRSARAHDTTTNRHDHAGDAEPSSVAWMPPTLSPRRGGAVNPTTTTTSPLEHVPAAVPSKRLLVGYMDGYVDMLSCDDSLKTVWSGMPIWTAHPTAEYPQQDVIRSNRIQELSINIERGVRLLADYEKRVMVERMQDVEPEVIDAVIDSIPVPPFTHAQLKDFQQEIATLSGETIGISLLSTLTVSADEADAIMGVMKGAEGPLEQQIVEDAPVLSPSTTLPIKRRQDLITPRTANDADDTMMLQVSEVLSRSSSPRPPSSFIGNDDEDTEGSSSKQHQARRKHQSSSRANNNTATSAATTARTTADPMRVSLAMLKLFNRSLTPFTSLTFAEHLVSELSSKIDSDNSIVEKKRKASAARALSSAGQRLGRGGGGGRSFSNTPSTLPPPEGAHAQHNKGIHPQHRTFSSKHLHRENSNGLISRSYHCVSDDASSKAAVTADPFTKEGDVPTEIINPIIHEHTTTSSTPRDGFAADFMYKRDSLLNTANVLANGSHMELQQPPHHHYSPPKYVPTQHTRGGGATSPQRAGGGATSAGGVGDGSSPLQRRDSFNLRKQEWIRLQLGALSRKRTKNKAAAIGSVSSMAGADEDEPGLPTKMVDFAAVEHEKKRQGVVPMFRTKGRAIPVFYSEDVNASCVAVEDLESLNGQMRVEKIDRLKRRLARRLKRAKNRESDMSMAINLSSVAEEDSRRSPGLNSLVPPSSTRTTGPMSPLMATTQVASISELLGDMRSRNNGTTRNEDENTDDTDDSSLGGGGEGGVGASPSAFEVERQLEQCLVSKPPTNPRVAVKELEQREKMLRAVAGTRAWSKLTDAEKAAKEEAALRALVTGEDYKVYIQRAEGRVQDPRETTLSKKAEALADHLKRQQTELEELQEKANNAFKIGGNRYVELPEDVKERRLRKEAEIAESGLNEVTVVVSPQKGRQVNKKEKRFAITIEGGKMVMNSSSALTSGTTDNNTSSPLGNTSTLSSSKQASHNAKHNNGSIPHPQQQSCTSQKYAIQSAQVEEKWITADPTDLDTQQQVEALHTLRMKGATTPLLIAQGRRHREVLDKKRDNYLRRPLLQQAAGSAGASPSHSTKRLIPVTTPTSDYYTNSSSYVDENTPSISSSSPIRTVYPDPAIEDMFPTMTVSNEQSGNVVVLTSPSPISRAGLPPVRRSTVSVVAQRRSVMGLQHQGNTSTANKSTTAPVNTTPGSHDAYSVALRAGTPQPKSNTTLGMRRRHPKQQGHQQEQVPPSRAVSADCGGFGLLHCRGIPPEMLDPSRRIKELVVRDQQVLDAPIRLPSRK